MHPGRFGVWRWEAQLADYYGETAGFRMDENLWWMLAAQRRDEWRSMSEAFAQAFT